MLFALFKTLTIFHLPLFIYCYEKEMGTAVRCCGTSYSQGLTVILFTTYVQLCQMLWLIIYFFIILEFGTGMTFMKYDIHEIIIIYGYIIYCCLLANQNLGIKNKKGKDQILFFAR